jgi:phosphoadenosine phosphosulfate reductase
MPPWIRGGSAPASYLSIEPPTYGHAAIKKVELDHDHGGIVKVNAMADWTHDEVWDYIREYDVPAHPLYEQGYASIGCAPCTRPVQAGEDDRAGRWWWEQNAPKECGIHCTIETGTFEHEVEAIFAEVRRTPGSS